MADYRLYCLDPLDHIIHRQEIEAEDDGAAIEAARLLHPDKDCELWQGIRKVSRIGAVRRE